MIKQNAQFQRKLESKFVKAKFLTFCQGMKEKSSFNVFSKVI